MVPEIIFGKCHLCKEPRVPIAFCSLCDHWFCPDCRHNYFRRGVAAIKELTGGKTPGCCGVVENGP